ncbi:MAG: preprotein translocase subunit SecG [Desulfobacterales bacterium]|nr:preprotein translocase subunit SecG [Desulfobacterales bacterium]
MKPIVIILHICICVALILIVLLQKGKGAGMGASFGGSSQTLFGSSGPSTFMQKVTTIIAVVFMLTSLGLSFLIGRGGTTSVMEDLTQPQIPITETSEIPVQDGEGQD